MGRGPVAGSVVGYDLVDPVAELTDPSVYGRLAHIAVAGAPGDDANKHPYVPLLADERASRVSLRRERRAVSVGIRGCPRAVQRVGQGADAHLARGSPCTARTDHGVSDA